MKGTVCKIMQKVVLNTGVHSNLAEDGFGIPLMWQLPKTLQLIA